MVTSWPPSSIALMSRPRVAISRVASAARASPAVSSACRRAREAAVSAVSAPAKKAAATRATTMQEGGERGRHGRLLPQGRARSSRRADAQRGSAAGLYEAHVGPRLADAPWPGRPSQRRTNVGRFLQQLGHRRARLFGPSGGDRLHNVAVLMETVVFDRQAPPAHLERADQRHFDQAAERAEQAVAARLEDLLVEAHVGGDQVGVARFVRAPCRRRPRSIRASAAASRASRGERGRLRLENLSELKEVVDETPASARPAYARRGNRDRACASRTSGEPSCRPSAARRSVPWPRARGTPRAASAATRRSAPAGSPRSAGATRADRGRR